MRLGVVASLIATAFWGFIFLAPLLLPNFTTWDIISVRYLIFGAFSLITILISTKGKLSKFPAFVWKEASMYAIFANFLYYSLLVVSIRLSGITICSITISLLPIIVPIYGNFTQKEFPFSLLIYPLSIIAMGLFCINFSEFVLATEAEQQNASDKMLGILFCMGSLALWTWYSVANKRFLETNKEHVSPQKLASLIGICCGTLGVLCIGGFLLFDPSALYIFSPLASAEELKTLVITCSILGVFSTFLATSFWNLATSKLPVSLLGQMMVFEPVAALTYNFCMEWRLPTAWETSGICFVLTGVILSINKMKVLKIDPLSIDKSLI